MRRFITADEAVEHEFRARDMQHALKVAKRWWRAGSWDSKCVVEFMIEPKRPRGDESREWHTVEVGADAPEPACVADSHNWCTPYKLLGGLSENPGCWSRGGTTMIYSYVCSHCGWYKYETNYGAQRNPGRPLEETEYRQPDDQSLAFAEKASHVQAQA